MSNSNKNRSKIPKLNFSPNFMSHARIVWHRLRHSLYMDRWFPHVPLALAVGLSGFAELRPWLDSLHHIPSFLSLPDGLSSIPQDFSALAIHGIPQGIIGALLMMLSIGLLWRSRIAWVFTFLMTISNLGLQLILHKKLNWPIVTYSSALLGILFLTRNKFHRFTLATGTLFALIGVFLTMGYGVLGSYALGKDFTPHISDFISALYFTIITMSTVGYGDITPHSPDARLFTVSLVVLGLVVFATSLTAIAGPIINQRMINLLQPRKKKMKRKDHIIVVGDNPLAQNTIKALIQRDLPVTAIWKTRPPEGVDSPEDLVIGDGSDTAVLQNADIDNARAILALGENDSDNAFVVLAAKDCNSKVRTVASVSDANNMMRIKHVRPDVVLALPVIGGELLAMTLSGEEIKTDALLDQVLQFR
jgi:voltage-gated potassium channel